MNTKASQVINLPGEAGRECWRRVPGLVPGLWEKVEDSGGAEPCLLAMEVCALDSAPFWVMAPPGGELDVEGVTALRWESMGQEPPVEGKTWICWKVRQEEGRALIGTVALSPEAPVESWLAAHPQAFEISPRLFEIPPGECAIWKELGRYVIAFQREDQLLHFAMLSERTLGKDAVQEIRELMAALDVNGFLPHIVGLRVWTTPEPDFKGLCETVLALKVRLEDKPEPKWPLETCQLLPPAVAAGRREAQVRKRWRRIIVATATVYVLFFAVWSGRLFWRQHQLEHRAAELARHHPEVVEIQRARDRWYALEPATDPDTYPVEVFHRLVSLLPAEGVQFERFDMKDDRVTISGIASSDHHALKFKADLTHCAGLQQYTWNFPQPQTLPDNRASFRAEGVLNGAGGTPP